MSNNPYSLQSVMNFINEKFALILIMGVTLIFGFFVGSLWTENRMSKSGITGGTQNNAGIVADAGQTPPTGPTVEQLNKMPPVTNEDWSKGSSNPKVTLVEYSDYDCPFCQRFHDTMNQVIEEYGDQVAWVFRHYPLSFHPNAQKVAEAAECVGKLGGQTAFWKFTDSYFERTGGTGTGVAIADIASLGAEAGVSQTAVQTCLDSDEMAEKVNTHFSTGSTAGVTGTPGTMVVVDGEVKELIPGALPIEQVRLTIEKYL